MNYLLLIATLVSTSACSSLLYYPDSFLYVNPKKLPISPEEIVFYENKETDEKLASWHFSTAEKRRGVAVIFHGNGQNLSAQFVSSYWLLDHGYDLFIFDYPGYGASSGAPTPESTAKAGVKALAYVHQRWPQLPVLVIGQSLGGAVAMKSLLELKTPAGVCALVLDSSFDSYRKVAQKVMAGSWLTWPLQWLPYIFLSDRHAPDGQIKDLAPLPIFVVHRADDRVVPSTFAKRIYDQAGEPKQMYLLAGSGHVQSFVGKDSKQSQQLFLSFAELLVS